MEYRQPQNRLPRLLMVQAIQKWWRRRFNPLENIGNFWCYNHFQIIQESQKTKNPIDYHIATMGVGRFITLNTDHEIEGPLQNACERVPKEVLEGILERSKGWL